MRLTYNSIENAKPKTRATKYIKLQQSDFDINDKLTQFMSFEWDNTEDKISANLAQNLRFYSWIKTWTFVSQEICEWRFSTIHFEFEDFFLLVSFDYGPHSESRKILSSEIIVDNITRREQQSFRYNTKLNVRKLWNELKSLSIYQYNNGEHE